MSVADRIVKYAVPAAAAGRLHQWARSEHLQLRRPRQQHYVHFSYCVRTTNIQGGLKNVSRPYRKIVLKSANEITFLSVIDCKKHYIRWYYIFYA